MSNDTAGKLAEELATMEAYVRDEDKPGLCASFASIPSTWQPIETAEKGKQIVDLWAVFTDWFGAEHGERMTNCRWRNASATYEAGWHDAYGNRIEWIADLSWPENEGADPRNGRRVTHWMPIPAAPETPND